MNYCFGVDIGGTTVKMGIFKFDGETVDKWEIKTRTENKGSAILPDVAYSVAEKLKEHAIPKEAVLGIGVGVPAPVSEDGIVNGTANLGWEYKEVKHELEELTGIKVKVGNDANVAALGEMWKGGGLGQKNIVMVTLGTGGHICVNYEETDQCGCGNRGCLEQYASATGIVRLAKKKLEAGTADTVLNAENLTAKDVFDAVKAGDQVAMEIAEEFGRYLGYALTNIAALVDPAAIVIGGGVSKAGEILLDYVEKAYKERVFFANKKVRFALAQLGNDAGIFGAAKMVLK